MPGVRAVRLLDQRPAPRRGRARRRRGRRGGRSAPSTVWSASLAASAKPASSSSRRTNARGSTAATRGVGSSSRAAVDDEHGEVGVVLVGQRRAACPRTRARVAGDDHRHDRRVLARATSSASSPSSVVGRWPARPPGASAAGLGRAAARRLVLGRRRDGCPSGGSTALIRGARVPSRPSRDPGHGSRGTGRLDGARRYARRMIAALAGGVGAARFLARPRRRSSTRADVTVVVNTGDDDWFHGLLRLPRPRLGHLHARRRRATPSRAGASRARPSRPSTRSTATASDTWFRLGDRDLATHLFRTERLRAGATLIEVTGRDRRARGALGPRLLPMTDDRVATRITAATRRRRRRELAMQEWFVRERCRAAGASRVRFDGADDAAPAPGRARRARRRRHDRSSARANPVISIGPILAVPGVRDALVAAARPGRRREPDHRAARPVKGPADRLMGPLGIEVSCVGVARDVPRVLRHARDRRRRRAPRRRGRGARRARGRRRHADARRPRRRRARARTRSPPSPDRRAVRRSPSSRSHGIARDPARRRARDR